jgi:hypothetical protein
MSLHTKLQARAWCVARLALATPALGASTTVLAAATSSNITAMVGAWVTMCNQQPSLTSALPLAELTDLAQQCAFTLSPSTPPTTLAGVLTAIVGQQMNVLGPLNRKFASLQQDDLTERLRELRHGAQGISLVGLDLRGSDGQLLAANGASVLDFLPDAATDGGSAPSFLDRRLGLFVNGGLRVGSEAGTPDTFASDIHNNSITVGADYRITDWLVTGAAYATGQTRVIFAGDLGRVDLHENGFSLYTSFYGSSFYLDLLAGYGVSALTTERHLQFTNTLNGSNIDQQAIGRSHLHDLWAGFDLGKELYWRALFVTPEAALTYRQARLDPFGESMSQPNAPGTVYALSYESTTMSSLQAQLGLHLGGTLSTRWGVFQPQLHGAFIRELRGHPDALPATFTAALHLPGATDEAYLASDVPDSHYFAVGAGIHATFGKGLAGFFDYEALAGLTNIKNHQLSLGVRYNVGE